MCIIGKGIAMCMAQTVDSQGTSISSLTIRLSSEKCQCSCELSLNVGARVNTSNCSFFPGIFVPHDSEPTQSSHRVATPSLCSDTNKHKEVLVCCLFDGTASEYHSHLNLSFTQVCLSFLHFLNVATRVWGQGSAGCSTTTAPLRHRYLYCLA